MRPVDICSILADISMHLSQGCAAVARTEGDPVSGEANQCVDPGLDGPAAALDPAEAAAPEAGCVTGPRRGEHGGRVASALIRGLLQRRRLRLRSRDRVACSIDDELPSG